MPVLFSWRRLRIQEIKMPFKTPQINFAEFIEDFHAFLHCDATFAFHLPLEIPKYLPACGVHGDNK